MTNEDERSARLTAEARDRYIDALTDVAVLALRKVGLLSISDDGNYEKLRDAIAGAVH